MLKIMIGRQTVTEYHTITVTTDELADVYTFSCGHDHAPLARGYEQVAAMTEIEIINDELDYTDAYARFMAYEDNDEFEARGATVDHFIAAMVATVVFYYKGYTGDPRAARCLSQLRKEIKSMLPAGGLESSAAFAQVFIFYLEDMGVITGAGILGCHEESPCRSNSYGAETIHHMHYRFDTLLFNLSTLHVAIPEVTTPYEFMTALFGRGIARCVFDNIDASMHIPLYAAIHAVGHRVDLLHV